MIMGSDLVGRSGLAYPKIRSSVEIMRYMRFNVDKFYVQPEKL